MPRLKNLALATGLALAALAPAAAEEYTPLSNLAGARAHTMGSPAAADGWTSLFNGHDLTGWRPLNGRAPFTVVDGAIVGTAVTGSPNSFLATEADYGDFVLEFEVRQEADRTVNSGVQFRSLSDPADRNGRVHGYQVEIDPRPAQGESGFIYDEGRRGWLYPPTLAPEKLGLFKLGEWNHYRVEAIGPHLRTWLNGVPVAHLIDDLTPRGFIALQVHSIAADSPAAGATVSWRNLRIRTADLAPTPPAPGVFVRNLRPNHLAPAEAAAGWRLLWDGRTTAGWRGDRSETFPTQGWEIADGVLSVLETGGEPGVPTLPRGGNIVTLEKFSRFELQLDVRFAPGANSGVFYLQQASRNHLGGFEYQILDDAKHPDAKRGRDGNRTIASLYDIIAPERASRPAAAERWHHVRIVVDGGRVEHWLNNVRVLAFDRFSEEFRALVAGSKFKETADYGTWSEGHILLQDHTDFISYRSIKVRSLP